MVLEGQLTSSGMFGHAFNDFVVCLAVLFYVVAIFIEFKGFHGDASLCFISETFTLFFK